MTAQPVSTRSDPSVGVSGILSAPRAVTRLAALLGFLLLMLPGGMAVYAFPRLHAGYVRFFWRNAVALLGIKLRCRGRFESAGPVLCVSNHVSYLDIMVLGALVPGAFISKAEVGGWPVIGFLSRLTRTVFIDRRPARTGDQENEIRARLMAGDTLILFPEGTSNDGNRVLGFKSALMNVVDPGRMDGLEVTVQPISVCYTRLDGMPIGYGLRPLFAWYGDMELAPHLWSVLALGSLTVDVEFHAPMRWSDSPSRKTLASACEAVVSGGVDRALKGYRS